MKLELTEVLIVLASFILTTILLGGFTR